MNLKTRRYLYITFILAFLTITPAVWLYAAGYKLGSGFKFEKTGILILDSEPHGATIYLNDKIQKSFIQSLTKPDTAIIKTPAKIKGLLPEEYSVRLELDGYWPWEKKLEIKGEQSTYAENITLFRNNLPLNISQGNFDKVSLSPDQTWLIANNSTSVILVNLLNDKQMEFPINPENTQTAITNLSEIHWSADSKNVIIDQTLFSINDWLNPQLLILSLNQPADNIKWHNRDNEFYYIDQNEIYSFVPNKPENKTVYTGQDISDYIAKDDKLLIIEQRDESTDLIVFNKNSKEAERTISLPLSTYKFINTAHNIVSLYDEKYDLIYLIDVNSPIKPIRDILNDVNKAVWINQAQLLYANNFEIFLYDINSKNKILLTRISQPISQILWHPNNNYVLFSTSNYISSIELDKRDKYNITRLLELNNIHDPVLNQDGDTLYFFSEIGNQKGVYKLNIQ